MEIRVLNMIIGGIRLIASPIGSVMADKFGRRINGLAGDIGLILTLFGYFAFGMYNLATAQKVDILVFCAVSATTFFTTMPIYLSEILP